MLNNFTSLYYKEKEEKALRSKKKKKNFRDIKNVGLDELQVEIIVA